MVNIAEGNGRGTEPDRRRFFEIARGSALECASIQDILEVFMVICRKENDEGKTMLVRIVSMLTRLGRRQYSVNEELIDYGHYDNDHDNDNESQPGGVGKAVSRRA